MQHTSIIPADLTITPNPDYFTGKSEYLWLELAERCKNYRRFLRMTYSRGDDGEYIALFEYAWQAQYFTTSFTGSHALFTTVNNLELNGNPNWRIADGGFLELTHQRSIVLSRNDNDFIYIESDGSLYYARRGQDYKRLIPIELITTNIDSTFVHLTKKLRNDGHLVYVRVNRKKPHQPKTQTVICYAEDEDAAVLFKLTHL